MGTQDWSDSFLNRYKQMGDQRADAVIAVLEESGELNKINDLLEHFDKNGAGLPEGLPQPLVDYLNNDCQIPDWADMEKIALAQTFFSSRGPLFGVVLLCGSLPSLYAGGLGGAQVLLATGQFTKHYERRAGETLRFILSVLEPGGLAPDGTGLRTIQKVRLMHAAVRYFASRSPRAWPAKPDWGVPINQEELTGTFLAFSSRALVDIDKMGIEVTPEEKDAYYHAWKVAAHMLGIEPEMVPEDLESAQALWNRIAQRNFIHTEAGAELAKCHLDFLKQVIPGELVDGIAVSLMRYLMGRKMTEQILGLPKPGWTSLLIGAVRDVFGLGEMLLDSSRTLAQIIEEDSIEFMNGLERHWMRGDITPFRIPDSLTAK